MNNGTIAPHVGREIDLVLDGVKPLATIERRKDRLGFNRAVALADTRMNVWVVVRNGDEGPEAILSYRPDLIREYRWLLDNGVREYGIKEYHRRMGRLFGYAEADIEAFIAADIDCDCSKCRGSDRRVA